MKNSILLIFLFFSTWLSGQSFEGTLTYTVDLIVSEKLAKKGVTTESLKEKMMAESSFSDTVKVTFKEGNYYTVYCNSKNNTWNIYKAETNKIYGFQKGENSDICSVLDASIDLEFQYTGTMPTFQLLDSTCIVNGITCKIVKVKWKSGAYYYNYNESKLKVNPELYSKLVYDGWAEFLKISGGALPLRIVKKVSGMMTTVHTLISEKKEQINPALFNIPKLKADPNLPNTPNTELMRIVK